MSAAPDLEPIDPRRRRGTCMHEAGHAVALLVLDLLQDHTKDFEVVVLDRPNEHGWLGYVQPAYTRPPRSERPSRSDVVRMCGASEYDHAIRAALARYGILAWAGGCSQFASERGLFRELCAATSSDRHDLVETGRLFGRLIGDVEPWLSLAIHFVDCHFGMISAVADVLHERSRLRAGEVREIIAGAPPTLNHRPVWNPNDPRDRAPALPSQWELEVPEMHFEIVRPQLRRRRKETRG